MSNLTPTNSAGSASGTPSNYLFGRVFTLLVSNNAGKAMDLSQLHVKFAVKKSGVMTPNVASIRVHNLDEDTAQIIKKEYTHVVLQAGYVGNFGVIFKGNIKQGIIGRESSTDTYIDLNCGDGDTAYNFAVVNKTIAKGSSQTDQLNAALNSMAGQGVGEGYTSGLPATKLSRGKVMYGNARDYMRTLANTNNCTWSIQDGKTVFLPLSTYLPNEAVVLTTKTGMVGQPQQTIEGIKIRALMNPLLKIHGRVKIDNKSVIQFQLDFTVPGSPANTPVPLTADGVYYILVAEATGDNRATDWYTDLLCLNINPSSNALNAISVSNNG